MSILRTHEDRLDNETLDLLDLNLETALLSLDREFQDIDKNLNTLLNIAISGKELETGTNLDTQSAKIILEGVKINLSKEDVIKIITEKSYDDKYLRLPENSEIYEGTNNTEVFFKTIDKVLSKEIKFDKTIISKLNSNNSFDYWDEYDTEEEFKVKDNNLIKKYLYNLCYDNYYDNVEQDHNGNILAYNFYWNIVANIIDLFKNKKLEK